MKKIIALAMSLFLGIFAVGCSSEPKGDEIVATIDGKEITVERYKVTLDLYKTTLESLYGSSIWEMEIGDGVKYGDEFKDMILDQIVIMEAVYADAEAQGLLPSDEEVEESFNDLKSNIEEDENYKEFLKTIGATDDFLREQEKQDLALANHRINFEETTTISEEESSEYYEENKEDFYIDEVEASHILISTLDDDGDELSEEEKEEAKKKAEDILERIQNGEEFSALAQEYSDDTYSGLEGGDLGYFGKGVMVSEFEEVAFSLEIGEVSEVVESQYGYHIIKVTDKIDEQTPFEETRELIEETLLYEKYNEITQKLYEAVEIEINEDILKQIKL